VRGPATALLARGSAPLWRARTLVALGLLPASALGRRRAGRSVFWPLPHERLSWAACRRRGTCWL